MARGKLKELVDFFENENGWDKKELIDDYTSGVLEQAGSELLSADELTIYDGKKELMTLDDFINNFFEKVVEGVCNVIKTA